MNAEEINEIYQTLAPMSTDYANANIERVGQAQSSYGPLAQAAMGDSQTAGVGNYTYNRLVRPSVDAMRDQLVVEGLSASMNKQISDSLKAAKDNYQRAYKSYARRYGRSGTGTGGTGTGGNGNDFGITEEELPGSSESGGTAPSTGDYIKDGYNFSNYGILPGQTSKKYPLTVDTPTYSTSAYDYNYKSSNPFDKAQEWIDFLYSIGYGG